MLTERAAKLAEKIKVHGADDKGRIVVTLPKPQWKGWTLGEEFAEFERNRKQAG